MHGNAGLACQLRLLTLFPQTFLTQIGDNCRMQIPPGKVGPTPAFFQALQGSPRPVEDAQAAASTKPVERGDSRQAVQAADRGGRNAPPSKETGRDFPRGSFLDIRA